jgi:radical SAM protein with 4Fe4S-binding SPASM domain
MKSNKTVELINKSKKTPISPSFCVLPWTHLMVQPNGNIQPCCMTPHDMPIGNTKDLTLEEAWNSFTMKNIRKKMLKGERPIHCSRCYLMDDNGAVSPRVNLTDKFKKHIKGLIKDTNPETGHNDQFSLKYWDFRWSNICNFKCRMCGTFASSKWVDDEIAIHGKSDKGLMNFRSESKVDIINYVDKHIHEVEEVYFAGGEPLIMDEHYLILEKLIAAGRTDVLLRYNTNFSHIKFKKWDLEKLWKKFQDDPKGKVQLFASLDATGKLAEVARHGTKWNTVYDNIKKCINNGIEVFVSPTISILNVFYVTDLFETIFELGVSPDNIVFNNFLTGPACYDIRILPDELKDELLTKLQDYYNKLDNPKYKQAIELALSSWIQFLFSDSDQDLLQLQINRRELLRVTTILDKRRDENFLEVNPQYEEWFEEIRATIGNYEAEETFFRDKSIPLPTDTTTGEEIDIKKLI